MGLRVYMTRTRKLTVEGPSAAAGKDKLTCETMDVNKYVTPSPSVEPKHDSHFGTLLFWIISVLDHILFYTP